MYLIWETRCGNKDIAIIVVLQVMNSHDGHMSVPLKIVKREVSCQPCCCHGQGNFRNPYLHSLYQDCADPEELVLRHFNHCTVREPNRFNVCFFAG